MSNFTNTQNSRTTNTSWRSRSYSVDSKPYNSSRGTTSSITVDNSDSANSSNKQHLNRTKLPQRTGSVTNSSGSSDSESGVHNSYQRNPLCQPRPHFAPRLSSNSSSDGSYLCPNKDRRNRNNYRKHNEQRMSNTWSLELPHSDSGSISSTESGVFSGDNSNGDINPVNSSNDRKNYLNFPSNQRNSMRLNRYPPGMPIPTPATHFASSENFNAPAASSLPQPPQIWLFGRAEALVKEEELEEERVQDKNLNTFDYYNLKMLLTVKA
ncbi:dentin sialophosphoprotein-like [Zeugodacus cucurbitae]|uniref:dentin sialophosphoprotein-like n=1 Tax=Zeugodacus cucurbitae TaxID=28588 RepID=UPI0023D91406|nr:dentin sialophosphoprotein-like [Zeugodacus cucurbitae]